MLEAIPPEQIGFLVSDGFQDVEAAGSSEILVRKVQVYVVFNEKMQEEAGMRLWMIVEKLKFKHRIYGS